MASTFQEVDHKAEMNSEIRSCAKLVGHLKTVRFIARTLEIKCPSYENSAFYPTNQLA